MAEFTPQQRAVINSTAKHTLVNAINKTGKTQILIRLYLNRQEKPGEFKAILITPNGLATQRILEQLQRITKQDWSQQLVGTLAEIGYKLIQTYYQDLTYSKIPKLVPDTAVIAERHEAKAVAVALHPDQTSQAFSEQWNQEFVSKLRRKDLVTPRSAVIEITNLFSKLSHSSLANVRLLLADDVHDYTFEEMMGIAIIQERMEKSFISGNTNIAINDRFHDIDIENWTTLIGRDGFKTLGLNSCFTMGANQGTFIYQLSAFNSKKLFDASPTYGVEATSQVLLEVLVPTTDYTIDVIKEMELQLQLGIRNRTMGIIMRNVDEARSMARMLNCPVCIMWDKTHLWHKTEVPTKGLLVTTPYDAPYLNLDYVTLPNCMKGYWPYTEERRTENCRRLFLRSVSSAKLGAIFLIPDPSNGLLVSPFVSEGSNPKLVTKVAQFIPTVRT